MKVLGHSPRSSFGLERPPRARGFLGGLLGLGFEVGLDFQADGLEVIHDFLIGKTNDFDSEGLEVGGSACISSETFRGVMLRAIEFNYEFSRGAIEIWDERSDRSLPQESNLVPAQKLIPPFPASMSRTASSSERNKRCSSSAVISGSV